MMKLKRFFLLLMLFVVPLQMSWAVESNYCQHETGKAAQHFGHHAHTHQSQPDDDSKNSPLSKIDKDCSYCHMSNISIFSSSFSLPPILVTAEVGVVNTISISFSSPDRPERPKWAFAI